MFEYVGLVNVSAEILRKMEKRNPYLNLGIPKEENGVVECAAFRVGEGNGDCRQHVLTPAQVERGMKRVETALRELLKKGEPEDALDNLTLERLAAYQAAMKEFNGISKGQLRLKFSGSKKGADVSVLG